MKRTIIGFILCALMAAPVLASPTADGVTSPHLGWWSVDAPRTTHQYWDFAEPYVTPGASGAAYEWEAQPTEKDNFGTSVALIIEADEYYPGSDMKFVDLEEIVVLIELSNYPDPEPYKELWVDVGYWGDLSGYAAGQGDDGPYETEPLRPPGPSGVAELGFRIYPNPDKEDISLTITPSVPGGIAGLEWIHVDTICVPVPAAVILGILGMGVAGLKLRKFA
jgi:hypothetical protein